MTLIEKARREVEAMKLGVDLPRPAQADDRIDILTDALDLADQLVAVLKAADGAINPTDLGGISMHAWNERLKITSRVIRAVLAKAEAHS